MRLTFALCVLLAAAVPAGCDSGPATPETALTILAVNQSVGRAVFHLDCTPAGGDLPEAASACAALASTPSLVTRPKPFTCFGGTFSWWDVTISGRLHGRPVDRSFSTCWTPQMATIRRLGLGWPVLQKHLARRHRALIAGERRTFPPGELRPGDLVTCEIRGHRLEAGVPTGTGGGDSGTGYGGAGVVSVTMEVARDRDGSVSADCRDG